METLKLFNLDFNFKDEHSGIISIIQVNYFNRILLDFYKIEDHEIIEIEVFGDDWGIINFPVQENASL